MKKFFFLTIVSLLVYILFFSKKKPAPIAKNIEAEEIEEKPDKPVRPAISTAPLQKATVAPNQNIQKNSAPAATVQNKIPTPVSANPKSEFRQLEDGDYGYYTTPTFLKGPSFTIFSLFYPSDVHHSIMPKIEIKDIATAFATGVPPSSEVLKALTLEGLFSGRVWTAAGDPRLSVIWNLKLTSTTNPAQGIFSLKINGIEKSCNATTPGPLQNISFSSDDNGAILVVSCDKSFYMQLYKMGSSFIVGSYFEKSQADGKYHSTNEWVEVLR